MIRAATRLLAFAAVALLGCRSEPDPDLILANVTVIDGRGGPPQPGRTIEIRNGRIARIREARNGETGSLETAGRFVIPGLFDSHMHLGHLDSTALATVLDSLLAGGITSIREMACCANIYRRIDSQADSTPTPRIFYSAFWADSNFFAVDPRVKETPGAGKEPWFLGVDPTTDLAEAVRGAKASGATGIKIYSNLAEPIVRAIAAEAHRQGMRVWSHPVVFPTRPSAVVAAGVDVISHASLLVWEGAETVPDDYDRGHPFNAFGPPAPYQTVPPDAPAVAKVLEAMKERGTLLDATVSTVRVAVSEESFRWAVEVTRRARQLGIPIVAGTDRGPFFDGRASLHEELATLVKDVGLTPLEALTAATYTAARAIGREADLGSVEEGKIADLVVLGGDPTTDVQRLADVVHVIKGGRPVRHPR